MKTLKKLRPVIKTIKINASSDPKRVGLRVPFVKPKPIAYGL